MDVQAGTKKQLWIIIVVICVSSFRFIRFSV